MDKDLYCFYIDHRDPYLKLGPFKYELKNRNPEVGLFHDLASPWVAPFYRLGLGKALIQIQPGLEICILSWRLDFKKRNHVILQSIQGLNNQINFVSAYVFPLIFQY